MATFAEAQVTRFETLMARHVGQRQVQVDGTMITFENLEKKYLFWKNQVAQEAGARARVAEIDLS